MPNLNITSATRSGMQVAVVGSTDANVTVTIQLLDGQDAVRDSKDVSASSGNFNTGGSPLTIPANASGPFKVRASFSGRTPVTVGVPFPPEG